MVAVRSKAGAYSPFLVGIAGSNLAGGMGICLLRMLGVFRLRVSVTGRSLGQRSPTECCMPEFDLKN